MDSRKFELYDIRESGENTCTSEEEPSLRGNYVVCSEQVSFPKEFERDARNRYSRPSYEHRDKSGTRVSEPIETYTG